jgi:hypothetical protein
MKSSSGEIDKAERCYRGVWTKADDDEKKARDPLARLQYVVEDCYTISEALTEIWT